MVEIEECSVMKLARGVRIRFDDARQCWILLAPERMIRLDDIGAAILNAMDGKKSFATIVDGLAQDYNAPRDQIAKDSKAFYQDFLEKNMIEMDT